MLPASNVRVRAQRKQVFRRGQSAPTRAGYPRWEVLTEDPGSQRRYLLLTVTAGQRSIWEREEGMLQYGRGAGGELVIKWE